MLAGRFTSLSLLSTLVWVAPAHAAGLRFTGPPECSVSDGVREQVRGLTGRALEDVDGVEFELDVARAGDGWKLVLRTRRTDEQGPRIRELSGASCGEVTDAAAVAIAMAVNEQALGEAPPSIPEVAAETPSSLPTRTSARPSSARPAALVAPERSSVPAFSAAALLHGALDVGALPNPAPGVELGFSVGSSRVQGALVGSAFAPQKARLDNGKGGEFRLLVAGALGCAQRFFGRVRGSGCVGLELGQISGEGVGVQRSQFGTRLWAAFRSEMGVSGAVAPGFSLVARVAALAPLARPEFVVDGAERVHRPSWVAGRALVGMEFQL